jgi:hypothetical protein
MKNGFPTHAEMLEVFATGLREHKALLAAQRADDVIRCCNILTMARINARNSTEGTEA